MNANTLRNTLLAAALITSGAAMAHGGSTDWVPTGAVVYTNPAYALAIHGSPNPAPETTAKNLTVIYTDQAYGQAIYSYPGHSAWAKSRRALAGQGGKSCDDHC